MTSTADPIPSSTDVSTPPPTSEDPGIEIRNDEATSQQSGETDIDGLQIAVSLSGGGYRAAAFGLGALMYLADANLSRKVTAITSVSGGSLTNAFAAKIIFLRDEQLNSRELWDRSDHLMRILASKSLLGFADFAKQLILFIMAFSVYLAGLILLARAVSRSLAVTVAVPTLLLLFCAYLAFVSLGNHASQKLEAWIIPHLPDRVVERRGARFFAFIRAYGRMFSKDAESDGFIEAMRGPNYRQLLLPNTVANYRPIFCATDLGSGTHFYISDRFVAGVGPALRGATPTRARNEIVNLVGAAPEMSIGRAVMASAAFPGALQPLSVKTAILGLPYRTGAVPARVRLADGGLYDNLGFTFYRYAQEAHSMDPAVRGDAGVAPSHYLVVNSGLPSFKWSRFLGPIKAFKRSVNVVHQANSRARREQVSAFLRGEAGDRGVIIDIGDDPYEIAESSEDAALGNSVCVLLDQLRVSQPSLTRSWWRAVSQEWNPSVKTGLKYLGAEDTARLVFHGYMVALSQMTSRFGFPLPTTVPDLKDLERRCRRPR